MKKWIYSILAMGIAMVLFSSCEKQETKPAEPSTLTAKKKAETFEFKDVLGNIYKAPLLSTVTKNAYDYSGLEDVNGYKVYKDKTGQVISKVGIDVSKYQKHIDWGAVKKSGIDFVVIRMGFRGYGAGTLHVDEEYEKHMQGALDVGLEVGVYFFSQAVTVAEAIEEADFVIQHIKNYNITYPVVFDTEEIKNDTARTDHLTKEQYTKHTIAFCDQIKTAGYEPMIYANMKWYAFMLDLEKLQDYPKWYADYYEVPQYPYEFEMWQYSESGTVPGIEGNVDMNLLFTKR